MSPYKVLKTLFFCLCLLFPLFLAQGTHVVEKDNVNLRALHVSQGGKELTNSRHAILDVEQGGKGLENFRHALPPLVANGARVVQKDKNLGVKLLAEFPSCKAVITADEFPAGTTEIPDYAFNGCTSLTSISLPDSVTSIGDSAFYGCSSLVSISLPDSVTYIGSNAFYGCSGLTCIYSSPTVYSYAVFAGVSGAQNDCPSDSPTMSPTSLQAPPVSGPTSPLTCPEVHSDGAVCLTYPLSGFCEPPSTPYTVLPPPSWCAHAPDTGDITILSTEIHYDFIARKLSGAVTIEHTLDHDETLFLTAKVFNSRTQNSAEKFRLGKGQFPLYKFNVSPSCPSHMVLRFDGLIPPEYNFDNADSFRVKIKRGKQNSLACANFYQLPLFEQ